MVLCAGCAKEVPAGESFCPSCGMPATQPRKVKSVARQCHGCSKTIAPGAKFCQNCGKEQNPAQVAKFSGVRGDCVPPTASPAAAGTGGVQPKAQGEQPGRGGSSAAPAGMLGSFEMVKPGSCGDKVVQYLTLKEGGAVEFREEGETSLESYVVTGTGRWTIKEGSVELLFPETRKTNTMKRKMLASVAKEISGDHVQQNDWMSIPISMLVNAPPKGSFGVHKW
eukprot:CAMPEP_0177660834 /NCGR_PEP_ID=MMETSP0447-20121125/18289_1 /TAXON_ID=0 /ORGANISM="Stygamoeba regulata, Strain BSH-02190019" /LENGTH=223 /DNA_ID=CAMNT_0019166001 /DNA_START=44 /DNA_END=712 /DNA_ORIENTATION=+